MAASAERLRERAESIRERLHEASRSGEATRPVFVEFSGTPKSGKSTCIDIVSHFFRRTGFRVLAPTEGASRRTPYYLKDDLVAFNAWSACYALSHLLEGLYHSDRYHLAILDRGLFDALVWFELLASDGEITDKERDQVHEFLLIDKWRTVTDHVFLFTCDPETSLSREVSEKIISDPGRAMNTEFLGKLNQAYNSVHEHYANLYPKLTRVDTSESAATNPRETAANITDAILDTIENAGIR